MEISIRKMKNNLSKYLKRVRAGKDVVITDRGRPVARLTPVKSAAAESEDDVIARIGALPWVRPGSGGRIKGAKRPIPWKPGDKLTSDIVLEDRD